MPSVVLNPISEAAKKKHFPAFQQLLPERVPAHFGLVSSHWPNTCQDELLVDFFPVTFVKVPGI